MMFLSLLGLDDFLFNLWKIGHFKTTASSFVVGIIVSLLYQRKTGDVNTAGGNSIISMLSITACAKLEGSVTCALFMGDDSFIYNDRKPSVEVQD